MLREIKKFIKKNKLKYAPFIDFIDKVFAFILISIIALVCISYFLTQPGESSVWGAFTDFFTGSGPIIIFASITASIALYKWRHHTDKERPVVREDFNDMDGDNADFGLRNFGPGTALYIQATAIIADSNKINNEACTTISVHDNPTHLQEGDFLSLVKNVERDWLSEVVEKYKKENTSIKDEEIEIEIYCSYYSPTWTREPLTISGNDIDRRDEDLDAETLIDGTEKPLRIELWRLKELCLPSSD